MEVSILTFSYLGVLSAWHATLVVSPCRVLGNNVKFSSSAPFSLFLSLPRPIFASFSGLCYATLLHASDLRPGCPWSNLLFRSIFTLLSSLFPFRGSFLQMTGSTFLLLAVSLAYGGHTGLSSSEVVPQAGCYILTCQFLLTRAPVQLFSAELFTILALCF